MEAGEFRQLCQLTGIRPVAPAGVDVAATLSGEDRRAFFAAWDGIPPQGSIAGTIADLKRQHWQRVLPPVLVIAEGTNPMTVVLHLPAAMLAHPLHWQLMEENEGCREGTVLPTELEVVEEGEVERERYTALRLPLQLEPAAGYHRLTATGSDGGKLQVGGECVLIVTPPTCYTPSGLLKDAKIWGMSCDLATIRSRRNWGCGDLTDLLTLLNWAADNGAATVAVSSLLCRHMPEEVQFPRPCRPTAVSPTPSFLTWRQSEISLRARKRGPWSMPRPFRYDWPLCARAKNWTQQRSLH
jgi:4-alpha-glucanotransferase